MKRVVITGATSLLGTALIDECIKNNIEVLALINEGSKKRNYIPNSDLVDVRECSLENISNYETDKNEYDAFVHFAWASTGGDKARNNYMAQADNIKYSLDAVELAKRLGCKTFIGAGSQAEYGRTAEVLTEETVTRPETAYGMAKLCAGQMTRLACKEYGMKHIWTRILSAYGPKYLPSTVINYTIIELLKGNTPKLSAGEQVWDFIYSEDVARAILLLIEKGIDGETYVIGSGESKKLKDYLGDIRAIINPKLELGLGQVPYGPNTVMHLACDISKLKRDTGFEPQVSFVEGIKKTLEWDKLNFLK